jgi:hypothetical protein
MSDLRPAALFLIALVMTGGALAGRPSAPATPAVAQTGPGYVAFLDIEGWYGRTPDEVAAVGPFDLALGALPGSLPLTIGAWRGEDRQPDPAVREWFGDPPVAIERTYWRADDEVIWLSAFGNRGDPSFHLFEHTPETCYPLSGWRIRTLEPARVPMSPRPITVNAGEAVNGSGAALAFAYVYVWTDPARDPENGVVSLRLAAPVLGDRSLADARRLVEREFLAELFTTTLPWTGF